MFAYLHADGMVRLRDADGEEIVAFDSGHGRAETMPFVASSATSSSSSSSADADSPAESEPKTTAGAGAVVVGMTADASEAAPVLVTAGVDGTARVHSLAVHYRDRQVAGAGRGRERRDGGKGKKTPTGGRGGNDSGGPDKRAGSRSSTSGSDSDKQTRRSKSAGDEQTGGVDDGGPPPPSTPRPPATLMGVGVAVEFKTCLGSACPGSDSSPRPQATGAADETVVSGAPTVSGGGEGVAGATVDGLRPHGEASTVTSMDAFYHRS